MSEQREYSNEEITVIWKPELCIHSAKCVKSLPHVFKPGERPWVRVDAADADAIEAAVANCPSGALTSRRENG